MLKRIADCRPRWTEEYCPSHHLATGELKEPGLAARVKMITGLVVTSDLRQKRELDKAGTVEDEIGFVERDNPLEAAQWCPCDTS